MTNKTIQWDDGLSRQYAKQFLCGLLAQLFKTKGEEKINCEYNQAIDDAIDAIIFHFPSTPTPAKYEPLAAIACKHDRILSEYEVKGVFWVVLYHIKTFDDLNGCLPTRKYFNAGNYIDAEAKARAYLEGLEDVKGGK